jgi:hypothetical protein
VPLLLRYFIHLLAMACSLDQCPRCSMNGAAILAHNVGHAFVDVKFVMVRPPAASTGLLLRQ